MSNQTVEYVTKKMFWKTWPKIAHRFHICEEECECNFRDGSIRSSECMCPIVACAVERGITTREAIEETRQHEDYGEFVRISKEGIELAWVNSLITASDYTEQEINAFPTSAYVVKAIKVRRKLLSYMKQPIQTNL